MQSHCLLSRTHADDLFPRHGAGTEDQARQSFLKRGRAGYALFQTKDHEAVAVDHGLHLLLIETRK